MRMRIHKEGYRIILTATLFLCLIIAISYITLPGNWWILPGGLFFGLWIVITRFFRSPSRDVNRDPDLVYSPADGTVVVVEETSETEYFNDRRIQVSIFMSLWNVHVNWYPIGGTVRYFKHHQGNFLVAYHPKSSEENERTTIVVEHQHRQILFRQIAGYIARRIVCYANVGDSVKQSSQCGFIKFGSRVDIFLPLDSEIHVKLGDKVVGTRTVIASLPNTDTPVR